MGNEGFELATEIVALNPVGHVTAVGCPGFDGVAAVDVGEVVAGPCVRVD